MDSSGDGSTRPADRDERRGDDSIPAPVVTVAGDLVALGPLRRDLVPLYQRWIDDLGTRRTMSVAPLPVTLEQEERWYEQAATSVYDAPFTIYELGTWRPVGTTDLHGIDLRHQTAEFGIMIGEREARGKGYGTETARLMLDYAFTALGLATVMLRVVEFNLAGRRAYEKAGFREFGRRRTCHAMGGRLWDVIYMDCVASEFVSPVLSAILAPDLPRST